VPKNENTPRGQRYQGIRVRAFSLSPCLLVSLSILFSGCSTAPIADFLDHFFPAKPPANVGSGHGGVCNPASLGSGGALSPNALPPGNVPPPLSPAVPPPGAVVAPGPVSLGEGNPATPNLPTTIDPPAFPLMSAPPSPNGADAKPLPNPPPSTPPPF
jgi:hypothetical protein